MALNNSRGGGPGRVRPLVLGFSLVMGFGFVGCGSPTPEPEPPPDNAQSLKEMAELYKYFSSQRITPPRKVSDLMEFEGAIPSALRKIQDGEIVVNWGVSYSPGSQALIAYERAAPGGGKALLRDGTVKDLSAAEFSIAAKSS